MTARLTQLVKSGGCGSKLGPKDLRAALEGLPGFSDPCFVFGSGPGDDAAAWILRDDLAIVQTVDFFAPIVDDPFDFGAIAAANSLSDCYALGAKPITALNIAFFPSTLEPETVRAILEGGAAKVKEAGAAIVGGHTVTSTEPMYGLSVTGVADPARIVKNSGARAGQLLVVTKKLGVGIVTNALKSTEIANLISQDLCNEAVASMKKLNRVASEVMVKFQASACTDITGFGLFGHAHNVAAASGVSFEIEANRVPSFPGILEFAERAAGGAGKRNKAWSEQFVSVTAGVSPAALSVLVDAQTSGPLLIALDEKNYEPFRDALAREGGGEAVVIGRVCSGESGKIRVL